MKIALLGDIALIGKYDLSVNRNAYDNIKFVKEAVDDCDFVIGNLESPLTTEVHTKTCKGAYLRSNPINAGCLKYMGVTHVTLANNHIFDYGEKGKSDTVEALRKVGIQYVGLNNEPVLLAAGNDKALLDGFCCYSANGVRYGKKEGQLKLLEYQGLKSFLSQAAEQQALPIASVHFGIEHIHYPSREHLELFRYFAKNYEYVLHGNHPHAIQGIEAVNNAKLFYALGNLCFDTITETSIGKHVEQTQEGRKSYIAKLTIEGKHCIKTEIIPVSDWATDILHEELSILPQLEKYSKDLKNGYSQIYKLREDELLKNSGAAEKHDMKFFMNRLNRKYIKAYLNGKKNKKAYDQLVNNFKAEAGL